MLVEINTPDGQSVYIRPSCIKHISADHRSPGLISWISMDDGTHLKVCGSPREIADQIAEMQSRIDAGFVPMKRQTEPGTGEDS